MTSPDEPQEPRGESQPEDAAQPQKTTGAARPLRRHGLWIALAAAVAVAGFAAVNAAGSGTAFPAGAGRPATAPAATASPGGAASPGGSALPNPDATEPIPAAIPGSAGVATSSSSHLPRKLAASLTRWKAGRGGATLAALSLQVNTATQSAGLKFYPTMRLACTKVGSEVTAARSSPPIPDAAMQGWYVKALAALAKAAADCRAGISVRLHGDEDLQARVHPRALSRSRAEFATGAADLFRATSKISSLGRH